MKGITNLDHEVLNLVKGIVDLVKGVADLDGEVQLPFIPRRYQAVSIHRVESRFDRREAET
jgi:hypothetical protein